MKKTACIALSSLACATFLVGCTNSNSYGTIEVGNYKNITVSADEVAVTDEEVEAYVNSFVQSLTKQESVTDFVQDGDTLNIDYVGKIDGIAFENGSATGATTTAGESGNLMFKNDLIGMAYGETKDVEVTFPEDYSLSDVAGKTAIFTITINSITRTVVPELTDELVAENTDLIGDDSVKTVNDLYTFARNELEMSYKGTTAFNKLLEEATVKKYNEEKVSEMVSNFTEYQESYYQYTYGVDLATYLEAIGSSEEEFNENIDNSVRDYFKQYMLVHYIADKEHITYSEEDYQNILQQYANTYGYESAEAFEESSTEEDLDNFKATLLYQQVVEYLADIVTVE